MRPILPISWLFVPASYPQRFVKAIHSGADAIIIDLEDTLDDSQKLKAYQDILAFDTLGLPFWVRVNAVGSPHFKADAQCLLSCQHLAGVFVPKAEHPDDIIACHIFDKPIIAMIESPQAWVNLPAIASTQGLTALSFGLLDLGKELGVVQGSLGAKTLFDRLRSDLVLYSSLNHLARPLETILPNFNDDHLLHQTAQYAYTLGFGGQLAIHPRQLDTINRIYRPDDSTYQFAQRVWEHYRQTQQSVFALDEMMIDLPVIEWAKNLLAKSDYFKKTDKLD